MKLGFRYGKKEICLDLPDESRVFTSAYPTLAEEISMQLFNAFAKPVGTPPLNKILAARKDGLVVIVVSDFTRPIPYASFLPLLLDYLEEGGVKRDEVVILVATGMHRASTPEEKEMMFGRKAVKKYQIIDHDAEDEKQLVELPVKSWSGARIRLNRMYVNAGFRILTGLVEPHFMAGFSGGRKSICPGLVSLDTIKMFHGYHFLNDLNASNTVIKGNPCHLESESIAMSCPADFSVNIVLDQHKEINRLIAGEMTASHKESIAYVKNCSCVPFGELADIAITSCGGYPLDHTFYQCVKGIVNCLPVIKDGGEMIAMGNCLEGVGSQEYTMLMKKYFMRYNQFLSDIKNRKVFIKDQWQLQMQLRVLDKIGMDHLHFYTTGIPLKMLKYLSLNPHALKSEDQIKTLIQERIDQAVKEGKSIAAFPEGPYCSPV